MDVLGNVKMLRIWESKEQLLLFVCLMRLMFCSLFLIVGVRERERERILISSLYKKMRLKKLRNVFSSGVWTHCQRVVGYVIWVCK